MTEKKLVKAEELRQHSTPGDCWLLINGVVWDLTDFAEEHPGGAAIIHQNAGRDASATYNSIHAPSLLANELGPGRRRGDFDISSGEPESDAPVPSQSPAGDDRKKGRRTLQSLISAHDFEEAASENLTEKAWAFFSSAATDLVTKNANESYFNRIWLRPQILRDVRDIRYNTKILGSSLNIPLFVSPTAMARMSHPDGELAVARGCAQWGIAQTISTNASYPIPEIVAAADIPFFFQLYVNKDRTASEKLLRQAESLGIKAVFVTVDQPTPGKREADERVKADGAVLAPTPNGATASNDAKGSGLGRTMGSFIDSTLSWQDIKWLRRTTRLPIVLKGVQTATDAIRAVEHGVDGLLIGNHGGRSLDTSPPAIMILLELQLTCPQIFKHIEVYVDGGIRRGTDMFKALCLGAKAVGMGRPFLYAANYGPEGVAQLIEIMKDEFETTMRMMGCTDLSQLHPGLLNLCDVKHWVEGLIEGPSVSLRSKL